MASPDWDSCRSFLAVARSGSLSAAARTLGLTQPTLGRHIAALEETLDTKLFTRSQRGLMPTAQALLLVPFAESMEASAEAFARSGSGEAHEPRGTVRLTASEIVGTEILPPMLTAFRERHPAIGIELAISNVNQDLLRREADIAIRMIRPVQKALMARRIGTVEIGLYAHRRYLAAHGTPRTMEDIPAHAIIGYDTESSGWRGIRQSGLPLTREIFAFRCDSDPAQLAHLRAGFGIGGCQVLVAARDPDLVRLFQESFAMPLEMWLVMHEDLRSIRRVRLLYDHLAEALAAHIAAGRKTRPRRAEKSR